MTIKITLPDDKLTFRRYNYKEVRDILKIKHSGVYFLYDNNDELLYVGKTNNFRSRLLSHFRGRDVAKPFYRLIDHVTVYFVNENFERELYETYAINTFKPSFNKAKTYYYDRSEKQFEIDERIRDLEDEKREIKEDILSSEFVDEDYEEDNELLTGVYFHNIKRLREIDGQLRSLKRHRSLTF